MTAIRSTRIARTEDIRRSRRSREGLPRIVAAAAVIAYGLAAPLQADHEAFDVTVTLTATPGNGEVTLTATGAGSSGTGTVGYKWREQVRGVWDDWWHMVTVDGKGTVTVPDLDNGKTYSFQAKAYLATRENDGSWHRAYSDTTATVTATPAAASTESAKDE